MSSSVLLNALHGVVKTTTAASVAASPVALGAAAAAGTRALSAVSASTSSFKLPDMPYDYGALEPYISGEIMRLHHSKHHAAYVNNLNIALEKYQAAQAKGDVSEMIALQGAIRFNGGGHINHTIFWSNLAAPKDGGGGEPEGLLASAINARFGDFGKFKAEMSAAAVGVQGSGWAWLGLNKKTGRVEVTTCANQDPLTTQGLVPLLGIDVWEHSYYLQYKNMRADYLAALWNIINWKDVAARLEAEKAAVKL